MEVLTGFGLASAAGLNAYIPLLALGLLARFTDLVSLPAGWAWLDPAPFSAPSADPPATLPATSARVLP